MPYAKLIIQIAIESQFHKLSKYVGDTEAFLEPVDIRDCLRVSIESPVN